MTDTDNQLLHVLRSIVCQTPELSNEIEVYDLESERIWESFRSGHVPALVLSDVYDEDFEFGDMASAPMRIVPLLWGTYRMAGQFRGRMPDPSMSRKDLQSELQQTWTFSLVQAGLSQHLATEITVAHGARAASVFHWGPHQ